MLSPAGCLVADPPLYEEPPPTPPVFDLTRANPIPGHVIVIDTTGTDAMRSLTVTVPFRSDDKGREIFAALHIDYYTERWSYTEESERFPPSTFDDLSRNITLEWQFNRELPLPGCHTLTLLATHEQYWDLGEARPNIVTARDDTAAVTWWLNVDPPEDAPYTLRDCPAPGSTVPP